MAETTEDMPMGSVPHPDRIRSRDSLDAEALHTPEEFTEKKVNAFDTSLEAPERKQAVLQSIMIIDGVKATMLQLQNLLEKQIDPRDFQLLTKLPRGGFRLKTTCPEKFEQINWPPSENEVKITKIENKKLIERRTIVLKQVPTYFDIDELDQDERIDSLRRITRKDGNPSTTIFITTQEESQALDLIRQGWFRYFGHSWKVEPYVNTNRAYCKVCKSSKPRHAPGQCTRLRCGICSAPHATRSHPPDDTSIQCPECSSDTHCFQKCPNLKSRLNTYREQKIQEKTIQSSYNQQEPDITNPEDFPLLRHSNLPRGTATKHDNPNRDLLTKLLEILVVLNVIPAEKVTQLKILMSDLIQPDPTYSQVAQVEKTHQTPSNRSRPRERRQLRSLSRTHEEREVSSQGWHAKRPCRYKEKGCHRFGNTGPMTMHERECPFKPNGTMEKERNPAGKSSSSLQTFFKKQQ
jgi:hypothetical protein